MSTSLGLPGTAPPLSGDRIEPLPPEMSPSVEHLVTEDDTPVDNIYSERQMRLLTRPLYATWKGGSERRPFAALANVALFYGIHRPPLVPDVLLSIGVRVSADVSEKIDRSYFIWEFGKPPDVSLEIVSNTEGGELDSKLTEYAEIGIPYYVVWDPWHKLSQDWLKVFKNCGNLYELVDQKELARFGLGLTIWHGVFEDVEDDWLRWTDAAGHMISTGEERADKAEERAGKAEERAQRLAEQLRKLGVEP